MRTMREENLRKLKEYLERYVAEHNGVSPALGEISAYMGMVKSTAYRHVLELERRGEIRYAGKNTLELRGQKTMRVAFRRVPVIGEIVCGSPDEQEEKVEGYLAVPEEWTGGECFLLRAYGDSMTGVGIDEGDLVLVRRAETAQSGQIVVALTENGTTLKRIFFDRGKPRLHAENAAYPPERADFFPARLSVQGVALKVIKDVT
ncbi:MAG: hypothetical protein II192_02955 [Clostridia bacterium]|nr:hypothetical protein [Clostridia bacterium]